MISRPHASSPASASWPRTGSAPTRTGRRRREGKSGIARITHFDPSQLRHAARRRGRRLRRRRSTSTSGSSCRRTAGPGWPWPPPRWRWRTPPSIPPSTTPTDERRHRQLLGRERVRPEGDPGAVGKGPGVRGRLPVDRLVLRGHHGPDLDQARHEGALRRGDRPRGRAGWTRSPHARRNIRRGDGRGRQRRHRGADRALRPGLPAQERLSEHASRSGRRLSPFDARANGYVPGEGGAILLVESCERAAEARGAADLRRDRRATAATHDAYHHGTAGARRPAVRARHERWRSRTRGSRRTTWTWSSRTPRGPPRADALEVRALREVFGGAPPRSR